MTTRLSPDLITEILTRLPPRCLLRFRAVSKWFCSQIDDPEFAKLHLRRSLETGSRQALIFRESMEFQMSDESDSDLLIFPTEENFPTLPIDRPAISLKICCSCNGLIVLGNSYGEAVVIWNPNTRKHRFLRAPEVVYPEDEETHSAIFGLGYDSLSDDYKLVRIVQLGMINPTKPFEVEVYGFKFNAWRQIGDHLPHPYQIDLVQEWNGVLAREALHFMVCKSTVPFENGPPCIIALNLHTEKIRELPDLAVLGCEPFQTHVRVLGGEVCVVFTYSNNYEMEAWAIQDYGGEEESWTKLLRFHLPSRPHTHYHDPAPLPLRRHENGPAPLKRPRSRRRLPGAPCPKMWREVLLPRYWRDFECLDFEERADRKVRMGNCWGGGKCTTLLVSSIVSVGEVEGDNRTFPEVRIFPPQPFRFRRMSYSQ